MQEISSQIKKKLPFEGYFALSDIQTLSPEILDQLSDEEKQEVETFTNLKRQREYVTSRLLLRDMVTNLDVDPQSFFIHKDELGQPHGRAKDKQFWVSIAHTDELVFCGITQQKAIGVDLEPANRSVPDKLRPRIMHPDEEQLFSEIETIRLWTIKEAYIKLRGQGLRLNMNQVHIQQEGDNFFVELNNDKRAKICSFRSQDHWLAIAFYQKQNLIEPSI